MAAAACSIASSFGRSATPMRLRPSAIAPELTTMSERSPPEGTARAAATWRTNGPITPRAKALSPSVATRVPTLSTMRRELRIGSRTDAMGGGV